jgi:hypothetical protein
MTGLARQGSAMVRALYVNEGRAAAALAVKTPPFRGYFRPMTRYQ